MPRYDGMDEILERLRGQMQVSQPAVGEVRGGEPRAPSVTASDPSYATVLENVLLLLRDVENLRTLLTPQRLRSLTGEQEQELLALLGKVLQELKSCEAALDHVPQRDERR